MKSIHQRGRSVRIPMPQKSFNIPIALIIFNRPETLKRVLSAIRNVRPCRLFVIADGPRKHIAADIKNCQATRALIDTIDWDCEIIREYSDVNLGCGQRPYTGITKAFENFEECIILEDDCIPELSFFRFCEELLEKYKHDERVMMISGNHHLLKKVPVDTSYFFSRNTITSGWATWRRAWRYYDFEMKLWPEVKKSGWLFNVLGDRSIVGYWEKLFDRCYKDRDRHYWDYQWTFTCWSQNALTIIPDRNLVSNIGFGQLGGSHYQNAQCPFGNLPTRAMNFPMVHPRLMIPNSMADRQIQHDVYGQISIPARINRRLARESAKLFKKEILTS